VQAFAKADGLLGLSDPIDEVLERWRTLDETARAEPEVAVPLARTPLDLVKPPPEGAAPSGGQVFWAAGGDARGAVGRGHSGRPGRGGPPPRRGGGLALRERLPGRRVRTDRG